MSAVAALLISIKALLGGAQPTDAQINSIIAQYQQSGVVITVDTVGLQ
jgi:hypothetical protein